jgi:AAA domain-containing protein/uncharacterized protein DUF4062
MSRQDIYAVGGTVQASNGRYIARKADAELVTLCRKGTFAYVLTARQMGKSSLMVRTAERLASEGIISIIIDLSELGVNLTREEWYLGILTKITDYITVGIDIVSWWGLNAHLGATQRMARFFEKALLTRVTDRIVVFVDEIDTTLGLSFADDFYAAVRYMYNARATNKDYERLSFVLIGVATPSELISDPHRTPFNIGQRVELRDFTFEETLPLSEGLGLPNRKARDVLKWVIKWTDGHPYLSQRLCRAIADLSRDDWSESDVDKLVEDIFMGYMSEQDQNLQFVRDMLTKRAPSVVDILGVYREIRLEQHNVRDERQSIVKTHLKLSGIVRLVGASLYVRNLLYKTVFDVHWIERQQIESAIISPARRRSTIEANVLISGTARDLPEHRKEMMDACLQQGMWPMLLEELPAGDAEAIQSSLTMIDQSDIYLGIFAHRYGYRPKVRNPEKISLAEMEYDRAVEREIPRLVFVMDKAHPVTIDDVEIGEGADKLKAFKDRLQTENTINFFTSPNDLRAQVIEGLAEILQNADKLIRQGKLFKSFRIQSLLAKDQP